MKRYLLLFIFLSVNASLVAQIPSYIPQDSLVAWYPFNGNANDESGNGFNATLNGPTLTSDRNGTANSAYLFNEDNPSHTAGKQDLIIIPNDSLFNSSEFSISVWVKLIGFNTENGGVRSSVILDRTGLLSSSQGDTTVANLQLSFRPDPDFATNLDSLNLAGSYTIHAPNSIKSSLNSKSKLAVLDEWYHLAMTYNGKYHRIYFNGNVVSESLVEGELKPHYEPILVGQRLQGNGYYYHTEGIIDDIALWGRGLTDDEIRNIYYEGNPPAALVWENELSMTKNNEIISDSLDPNKSYYLEVSGTFCVGSCWAGSNDLVPFTGTNRDAAFTFATYSNLPGEINFTWLNNQNFRPTPNEFNDSHTYKYYFTNIGGPQKFSFYDQTLGDNRGSLFFKIYELEDGGPLPKQIPSYIPQDSLVAWYPFNGNANDESGNGNNGVVHGATQSLDKGGNENSAYSFDGVDDYLDLGDFIFNSPSKYSISVWVKFDELKKHSYIFSQATNGEIQIKTNWDGSIESWNKLMNGGSVSIGSSVPDTSLWHHIAVVFNEDQNKLKFFIDGQSFENSFTSQLASYSGKALVGRQSNTSANFFNGTIDNIFFWNRALTDDEIKNIYYEGEVPINNDNNNNVVWEKLISSDDFPERLGFRTYAFDRNARKIYFLNVKEKWAYSFDIDKLEFESIDLTGYPSFDRAGDIIYNPENNTIQFWRAGTDDVFEFSVNGGQINKIGDGSYSSRMYGSDPIYNAFTKAPSVIFGYGGFSYSNAAYDLIDGVWKKTVENQSVEGFPYKRSTTIYPNKNYTKAYIIDGSGNKSGSQSEKECSIENGLPWASDVGKWCWLRDLWEINLEDWSFKQILPLNSNFRYTGSFGYDYSNDLFYSFGGFIPQEVYGQEAIRSDSLFVYDPTKNTGWVSIEQDGDIPASDLNKVSYYDNVKNRFIVGATDGGIWELKLDESVDNLFNHVITLDTLQVRKDSSFTVSVHSTEIAPSDSIESYQFVLPLSDGLTYTGYSTDSTHSTDGFISINETDSTLNLAFASNVNLSGTKPLIHLNFDGVKAKDYYFTPEKVYYNNKAVPGVTGGLVGVVKKIGDVDNDGTIFAFDAAKALRYSVGLDALPKLDPLPWEYWRQRTADVNDDGMVLAVDAADILKYVVGTIEEFTSVKAKRMNPSVEVIARDGNIYFDSETNGLFGINVDLKVDQTISYGDPVTPEGLMSAVNATEDQLKIGVASSEDITGRFLTVPITQYSGGDELGITYYINNVRTQYKVDMTEAMTDIEEELSVLPQQYELLQNYPNPFNPSTQIRYALPVASQVRLEVYNSVGQKVMVLVDGQQSAGYHQVSFNASGLSSGVYLYKLSTPGFSQTKKMLLIK